MRAILLAAVLAASTAVPAADTGEVKGAVKFIGETPKMEAIRFSADPYCERYHKEPVPKRDVVVNANGTLRNVLVHVKAGLPAGAKFPVPEKPAVIDQRGCLYEPHVLGVLVGQTLEIRNNDATMHNVNGRGPTKANPPFNFSMVSDKVPARKVKFDKPELPVKVKCDVHPWMVSFVGVFEHPYFAVSDAEGNFAIPGLPPGEYTVEAWHEEYGPQEMKVRVEAGKAAQAGFAYSKKGPATLAAP